MDFTNAGGNVLLALSGASTPPSAIVSLLLELDIHLSPDRGSIVVDHFHHDVNSAPERHDVLLVPRPQALRPDLKNFFGGDGVLAVQSAVGQSLGNASPLLVPILSAPETAYSYQSAEEADSQEEPFATGSQLALISVMQARNSARFTVLGSFEMLADKWFGTKVKTVDGKAQTTVNQDFAKQLTSWTFKESGVLQIGKFDHHETKKPKRKGDKLTQVGDLNPSIYRIKNEVVRDSGLFLTTC